MKLLGVVVTYYPDIPDLLENIRCYINVVDHLIIWKNTPVEDEERYVISLSDNSDKVTYLGTGSNEGIAYALNRSVEWGINNRFTHLLTMDQDSLFVDARKFRKAVEEIGNELSIGIYAPNSNHEYSSDLDVQTVSYAITSGSIFRLDIFDKTGLFREDYFIDAVDLEFCYRAALHGFRTVAFGKCELKQNFGQKCHSIFGVSPTLYSEYRTYNIVKNHIILWREYPKQFTEKWRFVEGYILKRFIKIVLFDKNKWKKLKALMKGIYCGITYKLPETKK